MSDGYELEELTRIEAALDALVSPTSEDVFQATRPFDERAIASVAATRAGSGGGGAQPALHGCMMKLTDDVLASVSGGLIHWDSSVYDTDTYWDGNGNGEFVIPAGLGGIYLIEAVLYVTAAGGGNPDLDRPLGVFQEPSDSCDIQFDRKNPDSNAPFDPGWWYGSGAFVRPMEEGLETGIQMHGSTSNAQSKILMKGGPSLSMITFTRLFDLPDGYVSPF